MDKAAKGLKGLEIWAKKATEGYRDVNVKDMSTSFRDGLAFCAIIHHYKPHLIDFESLSKENIFQNNSLAFSTAEKQLGVPALLDAEDMVKFSRPDRLSVITYLSQLHNCFVNENKVNGMKTGYKRILKNNETGPLPKISAVDTKLTPSARHEVCQTCKHRVYLLERLIISGKLYHRTCFKCSKCNSLLKPGAYVEGDSDGQYECALCPHDESRVSNGAELEKDNHSEVEPPVEEVILRRTGASITSIKQSPLTSRVCNERNNFLQNHLVSRNDDDLDKQVDSPEGESDYSLRSRGSFSVKDRISVFESNQAVSPVHSPQTISIASAFKNRSSDSSKTNLSTSEKSFSSSTVPSSQNIKSTTKQSTSDTSIELKEVPSGVKDISIKDTQSEIDGIKNSDTTALSNLTEAMNILTNIASIGTTDSLENSSTVSSSNSQNVSTTKQSSSDTSSQLKEVPSVVEDISIKGTQSEIDGIKNSEATAVPNRTLPNLNAATYVLTSMASIKTTDSKESKSLPTTPLVKPLERTKISFNIPHIQSSYLKSPLLSRPNSNVSGETSPSVSNIKSEYSLDCYLNKKREISARRRSSLESNATSGNATVTTPVKDPLKLKHSNSFSNHVIYDYNTSRTEKESTITQVEHSDSINTSLREKTAEANAKSTDLNNRYVMYDYISPPSETKVRLPEENLSVEASRSTSSLHLEKTDHQSEGNTSTVSEGPATEAEDNAISIAKWARTKSPDSDANIKITPIPRARKSLIASPRSDLNSVTAVSPDPEPKTVSEKQTVTIEEIKDAGNSSATITVSAETKSLSSDSSSETENKVTPFPRSRKRGSMRAKAVVSLNFATDDSPSRKYSGADDLSPTAVIKVTVDLNPQPPVSQDKPEIIYPDDLNPFGDDEVETLPKVEEYPEDLNPFGDDEPIYAEITYDEAKNPFASDDDADDKLHSPSIRSKANDSLSSIKQSKFGSLKGSVKKRKAPKPPPKMSEIFPNDSSESRSDTSSLSLQLSPSPTPSKRTVGTPSPQLRKNRPAPPPPPKPSRTISVATKEKKELDNMKIKSSVSDKKMGESSPSSKPKKKRPAPPVPIPPRREVKKIPLSEIQNEMKDIEEKQEDLEKQGRDLEVMIRDRDKDQEPTIEEEENIMQLFELVNQKNALFRRQAELMYIKRSQRLEEEQADIEFQIRCLLGKPQSQKCDDDDKKVDDLMQRLTDVVDQRNEIIESIERDRKRELEEDVTVQDHTEMKNGDLPIAAEIKESKEKAKKAKHKKEKKKKQKEEHSNTVGENLGKNTLKRMKWFSKPAS